MNRTELFAALPLIVVTAALVRVVPENPWTHLDNPSHRGVQNRC